MSLRNWVKSRCFPHETLRFRKCSLCLKPAQYPVPVSLPAPSGWLQQHLACSHPLEGVTSQDILAGIPSMLTLPGLLNIHQGGIWEGATTDRIKSSAGQQPRGQLGFCKDLKVILGEVSKIAQEMGVQAPHTREEKWGLGRCRVGLACMEETGCASLPLLYPITGGRKLSQKSRWGLYYSDILNHLL